MKEGIHPTWYADATVSCACGNTWVTGSTVQQIKTDVCSNCHPFYTGTQRIVDTEGQVDRFLKRLRAREDIQTAQVQAEEETISVDVALTEIGIGSRYETALAAEGVETIGDFIQKLEEGGDKAITDIKGIGVKTLIDVKKELRARGYEVPES